VNSLDIVFLSVLLLTNFHNEAPNPQKYRFVDNFAENLIPRTYQHLSIRITLDPSLWYVWLRLKKKAFNQHSKRSGCLKKSKDKAFSGR
jgi:hypothetical protein